MVLDKHKEVLAQTEHLATYYTNIDFPHIAEAFNNASNSIRELIDALEKVSLTEEGKDGQQL
jgi:hypothetical protein